MKRTETKKNKAKRQRKNRKAMKRLNFLLRKKSQITEKLISID